MLQVCYRCVNSVLKMCNESVAGMLKMCYRCVESVTGVFKVLQVC